MSPSCPARVDGCPETSTWDQLPHSHAHGGAFVIVVVAAIVLAWALLVITLHTGRRKR